MLGAHARGALVELEDYAIIGDTETLALVGKNGSIDWLCLPRFDSSACFAALLGGQEHGRFMLCPRRVDRVERRYRAGTLVLETDFHGPDGSVRIVDAMPIRSTHPHVVRVVEGLRGAVTMRLELVIRYDYGHIVPWVSRVDGRLRAIGGPDALVLATPVETRGDGTAIVAELAVRAGDRVPFVLTWHPSHEAPPAPKEPFAAIERTERWWRAWSGRHRHSGRYREVVLRSLLTLKALTYAPTGAILAAGTTSVPEALGGVRNWDYRFVWLRDATFTLYALLRAGYTEEAAAWRDWLLRAVAGDPSKIQTLYGLFGQRRLDERVLEWLPGYEGARPVRTGNLAANQLQIDVYGEVLDTLYLARRDGLQTENDAWDLQKSIADWLESRWQSDDHGLWEVRGTPRQFVHSKILAWTAFDRLVRSVEEQGLDGPVERWRRARARIHAEVCARGFDRELGSFTQTYGSKILDASLLLLPRTGFLPTKDPRVLGTIAAIERHLVRDGLVARYPTDEHDNIDGLPGRDHSFIACSFWLVDALVASGRLRDARRLFERAAALANDVGLLSEEYDSERRRLVGNFPQAFSHVALVNAARNLEASAAAEPSDAPGLARNA